MCRLLLLLLQLVNFFEFLPPAQATGSLNRFISATSGHASAMTPAYALPTTLTFRSVANHNDKSVEWQPTIQNDWLVLQTFNDNNNNGSRSYEQRVGKEENDSNTIERDENEDADEDSVERTNAVHSVVVAPKKCGTGSNGFQPKRNQQRTVTTTSNQKNNNKYNNKYADLQHLQKEATLSSDKYINDDLATKIIATPTPTLTTETSAMKRTPTSVTKTTTAATTSTSRSTSVAKRLSTPQANVMRESFRSSAISLAEKANEFGELIKKFFTDIEDTNNKIAPTSSVPDAAEWIAAVQDHHRSLQIAPSTGRKKNDDDDKKRFENIMFPLLVAYKLKFFLLIPVLISGLTLLVGSTGLAGFFFALFTVVAASRAW